MKPTERSEEGIPRRDWLLLPLVVLSVTTMFLGLSYLVADHMFPEKGWFTCNTRDRRGFMRHKPNCVCRYKNPEGPLVEYRFNECGYRSARPCGAKPRDTLRIVLMGASMTLGLYIPEDETFGARTEATLNRICPRAVEVQNMGGVRFKDEYKLAEEARRLSPDIIVLAVAPFDLEDTAEAAQPSNRHTQTGLGRTTTWPDLMLRTRESKLVFAVEHFMLLDTQVLFEVYKNMGGSREVLRYPQTPAGERAYSEFAKSLNRFMTGLTGSGVPVIVLVVPNRVAAAIVSNHSQLEGTDPWWFGRRISDIAVQQGVLAVDTTQDFANFAHAEKLFYPVDNHPNGAGHAVIAKALVDRLTDGSIPQVSACRSTSQTATR